MTGAPSYSFFSDPPPRIAGHRGAAGTMPENTLESFRRALEEGATFVEMDVHATRDGEIVIIHDDTVQRTTDGAGAVREMGLAELKQLDAGFRFTADRGATHPFRGRGIQVPTLREFFSDFPQARATLEIKELSAPATETLFDLVEEFDNARQVLVAAEDDTMMNAARAVIRGRGLPVATGFSLGEIGAFMTALWTGQTLPPEVPGQALQIPRLYQGTALVTPASVAAAHGLGVEIHVWTINEVDQMKELLTLGVDGIITDYPARLRDLVGRSGTD
jgi:glycerophosphoryl diester phosphodiesterase